MNFYRVTYINSGGRRATRTVDQNQLDYLRNASHNGIRVTSSRPATEKEIAKVLI